MGIYRRILLGAAIAMVALTACVAHAQNIPRIEIAIFNSKSQVLINGRVALTFLAASGGLSTSERARFTAQRIANLMDMGLDPYGIYAKGDKNVGKIVGGDEIICLVTKADAKKNKSEPLSLAQTWASSIRKLLLMPSVTLSKNSIVIPMGESRSITVGGASSGAINTNVLDSTVASTSVSNDSRTISVQGIKPGSTQIDVEVDGNVLPLQVYVKRLAGAIVRPQVEAIVTGEPCPASVAEAALERAVYRAAYTEPGAEINIISKDNSITSIGPGGNRTVTARVKISGRDYLTYSSTVTVEIKNQMLGYTKPDVLFYSNNPESVKEPQVLFAAKTSPEKETRLLYHHQNISNTKLRITVEVVNLGISASTFRIFPGETGINRDTIIVGYTAGKSFLNNYSRNVSILDTLPAQSRTILVSKVIHPGETASGILELAQTQGDENYVIVRASVPTTNDAAVGSITAAPDRVAWNLSDHVYPIPAKTLNESFEIGKQWRFISVGKTAIPSSNAQRKLDGNYGVSYHINLTVTNPSAEKGKVSIDFDPTAGLASVVSTINGQIFGEKIVKPPAEAHLASYMLEPGEVKELKIVFIPLAGSHYPAKIIVKS